VHESVPIKVLLDRSRASLRAGDAVLARQFFEPAFARSPGDVLEGLARASCLEFDFPQP
jgi:hypothetical protein